MEINNSKTEREFKLYKFKDAYGNSCSLQKSISAEHARIWLGIDKTKLTIFEDDDMRNHLIVDMPENWTVNTRMNLNQDQVKVLLPYLTRFAETGDL